MQGRVQVRLRVNGQEYVKSVEPRRLLVDFLRHDLGLTGTHVGCEQGICGSCSVLWNGEAVRSCLAFAVQADGAEIVTIEGVSGPNGELNDVQRSLMQHHALQCGYCTPGFIISVLDLLKRNPTPTGEEIEEALSENICRCTGYQSIVQAVVSLVEEKARARQT